MTTPTTMPAADVVGGLWRGALRSAVCCRCGHVHAASEVRTVSLHCRSCGHWQEDPPEVLRLDAPLGLGLAGLRARVVERGGVTWRPVWLQDLLGIRGEDTLAAMVALSTYYARTDRLCAAVGLRLEPGEVARWRKVGGLVDTWELSTTAGYRLAEPVNSCHEPQQATIVAGLLGITDPLDALAAALREVGRG